MNLNLPEKEKISKKRMTLYITIAIILVITIVIVVGVQVLGNDFIDGIFGINKFTQKTEEQEQILKNNFYNLFDNTLEDKSNYDVVKIDKQKEIVYTKYEKKQKQENDYEIDISLPVINIKGKSVDNYNKKIENEVKEIENELLKSKGNNSVYNVKYKASIENDIISLIIYSNIKQAGNAQKTTISTFNYNLENNKELELKDIIKIYNLSSRNVQNKINDTIKNENKKVQKLKEIGYNILEREDNSGKYFIENSSNFFIYNNNLYIIYAYGNEEQTTELDLVII